MYCTAHSLVCVVRKGSIHVKDRNVSVIALGFGDTSLCLSSMGAVNGSRQWEPLSAETSKLVLAFFRRHEACLTMSLKIEM